MVELRRYQIHMCFYFGDYERQLQLRHDFLPESVLEESMPGVFMICTSYFFNGLAAVSLFRNGKGRRYLRLARKSHKKLVWMEHKGVSCRWLLQQAFFTLLNTSDRPSIVLLVSFSESQR